MLIAVVCQPIVQHYEALIVSAPLIPPCRCEMIREMPTIQRRPVRIYGPLIVDKSGRDVVGSSWKSPRRWSGETKDWIVAESVFAGAVVSEVARRYEISP